ncbi:restriction endonuclease subunit S [Bacillus alkalicellulosilyticus]|uniref:restriction endonuclease subunit S n=1 Tax=Alkalihalobacterium alkalicellulosilyticum TaxID=1912214 RepID=UPI001482C14C|nr:restriction endonuclease subunit S [Bacillus alkalicellulosilyticus]
MKYKIRDVCDINSNSLSKKDPLTFVNYLDTANITEGKINEIKHLVVGVDKIPSRAKRKVVKNDIIISTVRPNLKHYGIIRKPVENMIVSTGFTVLTPKKEVNSEYLYWYLTQQEITNYLSAIADTSTTAYPSITSNVIADIELELPDRKKQDAIAKVLFSLNEKYNLTIEMNNTLEEIANAIFKRWFIDFEFPNDMGQPYKSNGGKFVDTELGLLPEGWYIQTIGDIADVKGGKRLPKGELVQEQKTPYPYLRVKDFTSDGINIDNICFISEFAHEKTKNYTISSEDIYISIAGTVGLTGLVPSFLSGANLTENAAKIINFHKDKINKYFVLMFLTSESGRNQIRANTVGSTQPKLPLYGIKNIQLFIPQKHVLDKFTSLIEVIMKQKEVNIGNGQSLKALRETLLPKLMSGEVQFNEGKKEVEECLQKSN